MSKYLLNTDYMLDIVFKVWGHTSKQNQFLHYQIQHSGSVSNGTCPHATRVHMMERIGSRKVSSDLCPDVYNLTSSKK